MVAKAVYAAAGPLERPTAAFVLGVAGVASNWASKVPVWEATALFCQAPALVKDGGGVLGEMAGLQVVGLPTLVYRLRLFSKTTAAGALRNEMLQLIRLD